jgi:hypothetical protein
MSPGFTQWLLPDDGKSEVIVLLVGLVPTNASVYRFLRLSPPSRRRSLATTRDLFPQGSFWASDGCDFQHFSPTSVQFKGEINGACLCKRHQKRHLEFCTAYLLSRGSPVRVWPGAPSH